MKSTKHKTQSTKRGFTLIETLVAISILVLALAGPLSIASNALQTAYYARDEVTAFYLAQEGLEYIRARRDQSRLNGFSWTNGITDCLSPEICVIDSPNFTHSVCPSGTCPPLLISGSGLYTQVGPGTTSRFTRALTMTHISADQIRVTVSVSWQSGTISRSFNLSELLFNWI